MADGKELPHMMFVNRKTTKFSLCFTPIHPVCGPVRTPISNDVHSPVSSDAAVFSDGLHHEGGPLVVGGRLDAVAVLVARRQLEPLVADLYDGCLGVEDKRVLLCLVCTGTDIFNPFSSMYSCISYPCLVKGGGDGGGAGDGGEGVLAPDGLDAADAQREVATEARVDVFAVAEIAG